MTANAECPINGRFVRVAILSGLLVLLAHIVAHDAATYNVWGTGWPFIHSVTYYRVIFTIWATVILLTPALCFFILLKPGAVETYSRSFWTFAYIALLFHLCWAIFGICQGNLKAIFHGHAGNEMIPGCTVEHPGPDLALAILWGFDIALLWLVRQDYTWIRRFTGFVHALVFAMFVKALMAPKASRGAHLIGMLMAGIVLSAYMTRVIFRQPDPKSFGVFVYVTLFRIINRIRIVVGRRLVWHRMPLLFAIGNLDALREVLRARNLHNTSDIPVSNPAGLRPPVPYRPAYLHSREADGWYNDLTKPEMGSASLNEANPTDTPDFTLSSPGARFGRNIPLSEVDPERDGGLLEPNPREISNRLLARRPGGFIPAESLNLLAAAWIQFQVHDWFNHGNPEIDDVIEVPTRPGDEPLVCPMRIRRTRRDPTRKEDDGNGPVTYVNAESHWWDGSQIYGSSEEAEGHLREHRGGRLALDDRGLLLMEENALERTGLSANWWIGLSLMHNLFAREHNAICDHLRREYPGWDDDQLYRTARLVNVALMAKIHTLEWTPAILGHPVLQVGMKGNWWGFATERIKKVLRRISEGELVSGIPGSETNHHGADYCLTEEFVSVYRMHALMPDRVAVYRVADGQELETRFTLDAEKDRTSVDVVNPGARDAPPPETEERRHARRVHRPRRHRHRQGPRARRAPVQPLPGIVPSPSRQVFRGAGGEAGVGGRAPGDLRPRGPGRPHGRHVCGAEAGGLWDQRHRVSRVLADGLAAAQERPVLHERLYAGDLQPRRHRLGREQHHADGTVATLPRPRRPALSRQESVCPVERCTEAAAGQRSLMGGR